MKVVVVDSEMPIAQEDLVRLEDQLKIELPDEYRRFLLQNNGGRPEPDVFRFIDSSQSITQDSVAWFMCIKPEHINDLYETMSELTGRIPDNMLPIAVDSFGNYICLITIGESRGEIYFWDHELETEDKNTFFVAFNFNTFLQSLSDPDT